MATGDGTTCPHCGQPVEQGFLTANAGRWWGGGKLGWVPGELEARHVVLRGEPLVESVVGGVHTPANRCASCRLVWFHYPET